MAPPSYSRGSGLGGRSSVRSLLPLPSVSVRVLSYTLNGLWGRVEEEGGSGWGSGVR